MLIHARLRIFLFVAPLALAACASPAPEAPRGTDVAPTAFGRGVFTVNTDYQSTNISLVGLDGSRLSGSFLSSDLSSSALSADVYPPSMTLPGDDLVLLDRSRSLVTWADVRTAEIRAQFHAGDKDAQNPWDYLPVAADKAYIVRYQPTSPGGSGDVIVVNPMTASVTTPVGARVAIDTSLPSGYGAFPARGVVAGGRAYVVVVVATSDYQYDSSYIVAIDTTTDKVVQTRTIDGVHDCTGMALSPSGAELALSCSGDLLADGSLSQANAGVVLLATEDLSERGRFDASALGAGVPGFFLSYASERKLLAVLTGNVNDTIDDAAVEIDLDSKKPREVHRAPPFQIGAALCPARIDGKTGEPPACFITDADKGVLLRYPVDGGSLGAPTSIVVDDEIGLPPRYLGQF